MNPVTHLLAGWIIADEFKLEQRDRAIVSWSCVVSDLDGSGYLLDLFNDYFGSGQTSFYEEFHRNLGHGLPAAVFVTAFACLIAINKRKTAILAFITFHLHLFMDLIGSRGSNPIDIWPIHYFGPISEKLTVAWSGQWPLTGWQNTTITIILMLFCFYTAVNRGYSPVSLFNKRADSVFVEVLKKWFGNFRKTLPDSSL